MHCDTSNPVLGLIPFGRLLTEEDVVEFLLLYCKFGAISETYFVIRYADEAGCIEAIYETDIHIWHSSAFRFPVFFCVCVLCSIPEVPLEIA